MDGEAGWWTTSGNIGLPPLARVMGVGRQQQVERVQRRAARFFKSRYLRYCSVSDMLDVLGLPPLSQRRQEARLILFF